MILEISMNNTFVCRIMTDVCQTLLLCSNISITGINLFVEFIYFHVDRQLFAITGGIKLCTQNDSRPLEYASSNMTDDAKSNAGSFAEIFEIVTS